MRKGEETSRQRNKVEIPTKRSDLGRERERVNNPGHNSDSWMQDINKVERHRVRERKGNLHPRVRKKRTPKNKETKPKKGKRRHSKERTRVTNKREKERKRSRQSTPKGKNICWVIYFSTSFLPFLPSRFNCFFFNSFLLLVVSTHLVDKNQM